MMVRLLLGFSTLLWLNVFGQTENGMTIMSRYNPPEGYTRKPVDKASFAFYLRHLPLKPKGSLVRYYNGAIKQNDVYDAVVDMDISNRDLQQCADAIMRLRGEYLYAKKAYDQISFTLTNGFRVDYTEWIQGKRVIVNGNTTVWQKTAKPSNTYQDFRNYMEFIFMYAGTLSLAKELQSKPLADIAIGDVFIKGGSPGHAVIVVDLAENQQGEKVFLLAQSYMPAQETQILKNTYDNMSPWYRTTTFKKLYTPEWTFEYSQLKTW
ncbi:MAG: DUF4846 domain-containing protein [Sphingomonadales bacterium]